jgi:hypothetical protein
MELRKDWLDNATVFISEHEAAVFRSRAIFAALAQRCGQALFPS